MEIWVLSQLTHLLKLWSLFWTKNNKCETFSVPKSQTLVLLWLCSFLVRKTFFFWMDPTFGSITGSHSRLLSQAEEGKMSCGSTRRVAEQVLNENMIRKPEKNCSECQHFAGISRKRARVRPVATNWICFATIAQYCSFCCLLFLFCCLFFFLPLVLSLLSSEYI